MAVNYRGKKFYNIGPWCVRHCMKLTAESNFCQGVEWRRAKDLKHPSLSHKELITHIHKHKTYALQNVLILKFGMNKLECFRGGVLKPSLMFANKV